MDFPHYIIFTSEVVGALTIIAGMLGAVYKFGVKPIVAHLREVRMQFEKLDTIYKELQPNGGGSLKDAINQIRSTVRTIEKRQRAWLSYEDQGIFETDPAGHLLWCNRAYLKMLNVTFEEAAGNGWKNFIHPTYKQRVFSEWASAVIDKRDCKGTYKYLTADGRDVCATCEAFAIKDDLGALTGYVGVVSINADIAKCD